MTGGGWLSDMPERWRQVPAKALFGERRAPCHPDDEHLTPSQLHGVLTQADYMRLTGNRVVLNFVGQDAMKHVEVDDFIIHLRSFQGGIERSRLAGKVSTAYTVLRPTDFAVADYFRWVLKSDGYVQELRTTTNQLRDGQSIKYRDFAKVPLPCPHLSEQRAIATYLEHEVAQIDALIAKQERLIETLGERRRAVTSAAVTRGLTGEPCESDPLVGPVPDGWQVRRVKDLYELLDWRRVPLSGEERGGRKGIYPYYGASGVIDHINDYLFDEPLVLMAEDGANLRLRSTPVAFVATGQYWVNNHAHVLRPRRGGGHRYWAERLEHATIAPYVTGAAQPKFTAQALLNLKIAVPASDGEVSRIVAHIEEQTERIDTLIAKADQFITVAKERRSALITAAVTGQINVQAAS